MTFVEGTDIRYGNHRFGFGTLHEFSAPPEVKILPDEEVAIMYGWSNGCPFPNTLIQPEMYGASWMRARYSDTNQTFHEITGKARFVNPLLAEELLEVYPRRLDLGEGAGDYEPQSVPDAHQNFKYPMSDLIGYAFPRVHIEMRGREEPRSIERAARAFSITMSTIAEAPNKHIFLARLSREAVMQGVDSELILSHILPAGVLKEENNFSTYRDFIDALKVEAGSLYTLYSGKSHQEKADKSLADLD